MSSAAIHSITLPTPAEPPMGGASIFRFDGWPIRVFGTAADPAFVALDVCNALGLRDVSDAVAKLDPDEKGRASIPTPGGRQELLTVTESGLYVMILRARSATTPGSAAHRFKRWVTGEVLPEIRRTGAYAPAAAPAPAAIDVRDPRQMALIATQLIALTQEQAREIADLRVDLSVAETKIEMDRPKLQAYEAFLDDEGLCTLQSAARAVDAPQAAFFTWLRKRGWLVDQEGWTQPGWERRRDRHFVVRHREVGGVIRSRTYVTRGGLVWLRDRWAAHLIVEARDAEKARLQGDLGL